MFKGPVFFGFFAIFGTIKAFAKLWKLSHESGPSKQQIFLVWTSPDRIFWGALTPHFHGTFFNSFNSSKNSKKTEKDQTFKHYQEHKDISLHMSLNEHVSDKIIWQYTGVSEWAMKYLHQMFCETGESVCKPELSQFFNSFNSSKNSKKTEKDQTLNTTKNTKILHCICLWMSMSVTKSSDNTLGSVNKLWSIFTKCFMRLVSQYANQYALADLGCLIVLMHVWVQVYTFPYHN